MNRIQPIAAHVAYMTCPGNHGNCCHHVTVDWYFTCCAVMLQRSRISSAITLTGSLCRQATIRSGTHGIWAQYISSGIYKYNNNCNNNSYKYNK